MTLVVRDGRQRAAALRTVPIGLVILLMSAGAAREGWRQGRGPGMEESEGVADVRPGDAVLFRRTVGGGLGSEAIDEYEGGGGEGARSVTAGWHIEQIETVGGSPHGIYIGGDVGPLNHFRIRNVVVRHVTGEPKSKYSGLVVVDGTPGAVMQDVVIDGVIAHDTTQWAGVLGARTAAPAAVIPAAQPGRWT